MSDNVIRVAVVDLDELMRIIIRKNLGSDAVCESFADAVIEDVVVLDMSDADNTESPLDPNFTAE